MTPSPRVLALAATLTLAGCATVSSPPVTEPANGHEPWRYYGITAPLVKDINASPSSACSA